MKDWWKWALAGAIAGGLLTGLLIERVFTQREQDWLADRDSVTALHVADSIALVATLAAQAEAQRRLDAALAEAARLEREGDVLAGQVAGAKAQLAAAATLRDSMAAALVVIADQDAVIEKRDSTISSLHTAIAAAAERKTADSVALGLVTRDRDRLLVLVGTAPVGRPKPRLLGILPMPKFVVGGGLVGDKDRIGLGLFAGPAFPL